MFTDGTRAAAAEIRDWNEPAAPAKIDGRALFDADVPVRWIIDRSQPPVPKPPLFIEFVGGDLLAGEVISYSEGSENPYERQPRHLIIKPAMEIQPPDALGPVVLRVTTEWIQRVVWDHLGTDEYRPGTLWLRSGMLVAFKSLRWTPTGVTVLTSDGLQQLALSDLAEVHLPRMNAWTSYFEQLAALSPDAVSRLIQIQSQDGSRWTTSTERFQPRHQGDRHRPEQWYQLIQPAWSLDSLWLRFRSIRAWRFFPPQEVPLSNFLPDQATHQAVFGEGLEWQADQTVQHGPLQSLDQDFGWGFGVHGTSELLFSLPESARAFRTGYGLDRAAGNGGCINIDIVAGNNQSLFKQTNLIGAAAVGQTDWQPLPAGPGEQRQIALRTDMAEKGRPADADPFDIRDLFNWYEPELRLDQKVLTAEVSRRGPARLAGLIGWTIDPETSRSIRVANVVDDSNPRDPAFRLVARSTAPSYTLSRKLSIGRRNRWLNIVASRFAETSSPSTLQVRIDGQDLGRFDVPIRQSITDPEPIVVSVEPFQGRTVVIEVVVHPTDERSWVDWRGFSIGAERPGLLTLFEEDEKFAELLNHGSGRVEIDTEKPYSGKRSLKMTPGAGHNPMIPGWNALICEHPRLGQYRHLVFAWKKSTGTRIQLQLAHQGRLGDGGPPLAGEPPVAAFPRGWGRPLAGDDRGRRFGYCYEAGVATTQPPTPLWMHGNLPRAWQLVERDLFNDFGVFTVTGLSLNCVDGDAAWFDHLYLARTKQDVEYAATLLAPAPPNVP